MIVLENFSKSYGRHTAVENLSFSAESACITALAGLNGAGKTTVLKAICGIHRADSGLVSVNGIDTAENPVEAASLIGFMSEHAVFPPFFTVYEFLYGEALILCEAQKAAGNLERVMSLCDLEALANRKIASLSNGEKKRTALARSLLSDPEILILDEPASGLDPAQSARMRSLIAAAGKTKTVLFSTHLIHEMENLCTEIVILHKGRLAAQGSVSSLCVQTGADNLETAFLRITGEEH
ncbi:ABC transporter ATP-binding protein [Treponema sp. HNW]|uniref:ABC transporter ATP-binding protein n=1 Tax=Treponema sp. HNW TaxID=3116654 RepID=UPI003D1328C6